PQGVTLAEAAQFYTQKHPANMPRKTVAEVVAEFIADRRSAAHENFGILAVEFAADVREAVGNGELVTKTLAFFFVASDALGELEADVLQMHKVWNHGLCFK